MRILDSELKKEAVSSRQYLERALGRPVRLFSYPYGLFTGRLKDILRDAGYTAACSSIIGKNNHDSDFYLLKRTEITGYDGRFEFEKKISGYYDWITHFNRRQYDRSKYSYAI